MPLVKVGFAVGSEQQVSRAFLALEHEVADMSTPLDRMADVVLQSVREQFTTQGESGLGHMWTPLTPEYAAWKLVHFGPRPILVASGGSKGAALNKAQAVTVTSTRMIYEPKGKGGEILAWHQTGAGDLPQRKVVALTEAQKRAGVDRVFTEWLHEVRAKVGIAS